MSEETKEQVETVPNPSRGKDKFLNADEYSKEELEVLSKLYSQSFKDVKEGEIIKGKIVGRVIMLFLMLVSNPKVQFPRLILQPARKLKLVRMWKLLLKAWKMGRVILYSVKRERTS